MKIVQQSRKKELCVKFIAHFNSSRLLSTSLTIRRRRLWFLCELLYNSVAQSRIGLFNRECVCSSDELLISWLGHGSLTVNIGSSAQHDRNNDFNQMAGQTPCVTESLAHSCSMLLEKACQVETPSSRHRRYLLVPCLFSELGLILVFDLFSATQVRIRRHEPLPWFPDGAVRD